VSLSREDKKLCGKSILRCYQAAKGPGFIELLSVRH
jgi:hypothetical protein